MLTEQLSREGNGETPFENAGSQQKALLAVLNLTDKSSAEDARRVAISLRLKFQAGGEDARHLEALRWVLKQTRDILNDEDFLEFILGDTSLEQTKTQPSEAV